MSDTIPREQIEAYRDRLQAERQQIADQMNVNLGALEMCKKLLAEPAKSDDAVAE